MSNSQKNEHSMHADGGHAHGGGEDKPMRSNSIKDFLPLIVIFAIVIGLTVWRSVGADVELMAVMGNFMGFFFLIFGGFKIINWKGFADAYQIYDIVAKRSRAYAYVYPLIELALGAAYLFVWYPIVTNGVTLAVMSVSAVGVFQELRKKNKIPCACLGVVFKIPMTKVTLIEDLLMAGMALTMLILLV